MAVDIRPLIPPQILMEDYPLTMKAAATVLEGRKSAEEILRGEDDRLLVVSTCVCEGRRRKSSRLRLLWWTGCGTLLCARCQERYGVRSPAQGVR